MKLEHPHYIRCYDDNKNKRLSTYGIEPIQIKYKKKYCKKCKQYIKVYTITTHCKYCKTKLIDVLE